jgi:hypothetical protein
MLYTAAAPANRAAALLKLSFQEIADHPLRFVKVLFGFTWEALTTLLEGPRMRLLNGRTPMTWVGYLIGAFTLAGLIALLRHAFDRRNALVLLANAGFVASLPFIFDDGGQRVLAPAMPFFYFLAAYGVLLAGRFFECVAAGHLASPALMSPENGGRWILIVPAATLLIVAVIPFALAGSWKPATLMDSAGSLAASCPAAVTVDESRLIYDVRVHPGEGQIHGSLFDLTYGEVQSSLNKNHIDKVLRHYQGPYTFFGVMFGSRNNRHLQIIIWEGQHEPLRPPLTFCVEKVSQDLVRGKKSAVYRVVGQPTQQAQ